MHVNSAITRHPLEVEDQIEQLVSGPFLRLLLNGLSFDLACNVCGQAAMKNKKCKYLYMYNRLFSSAMFYYVFSGTN